MTANAPVCMTEEYWANSQLSITRYYGRVRFCGHEYWIVNKEGKDLFQCAAEAKKSGREYVIMPGEPCDLVRKDFIPFYRKLGREKFLAVLKDHLRTDDKELKAIYKELTDKRKGGER